jgi:hypothetical protein
VFIAYKAIKWISNNKNSDKKRKKLCEEFYQIVIPQIILGKSYCKKAKASADKSLYIIQSSYYIGEAIKHINEINVNEVNRWFKTKEASKELIRRLGKDVYGSVIDEVMCFKRAERNE